MSYLISQSNCRVFAKENSECIHSMAWTVSSLYKTDGTHCIVKRHEVIVTSYRLSRWFLRFGSGNFLKGIVLLLTYQRMQLAFHVLYRMVSCPALPFFDEWTSIGRVE